MIPLFVSLGCRRGLQFDGEQGSDRAAREHVRLNPNLLPIAVVALPVVFAVDAPIREFLFEYTAKRCVTARSLGPRRRSCPVVVGNCGDRATAASADFGFSEPAAGGLNGEGVS